MSYDGAPEIKHITFQEMLQDDIPEDEITEKLMEWDENTHLHDYPGEMEIDNHYIEEYVELRSIGLTDPQAKKVMTNVE